MKKIAAIMIILALALFTGCSQSDSSSSAPSSGSATESVIAADNAAVAEETGSVELTEAGITRPDIQVARVGVMKGSINVDFARSHYPDAELIMFNDYMESAAALQAGIIDYAIMDYATALGIIKHHNELGMLPEPVRDEATSIALNKKNAELNEKIEALVDEYIDNGTLDEIIAHWIKPDGGDYDYAEIEKLADAPVLKVAVTSATEPRCFMYNGKLAGMVVELADRITYDLGMVAEYRDMAFSEQMASLEAGDIDMVPAMYATAARMEQADFTAAYFDNPQVLVIKK